MREFVHQFIETFVDEPSGREYSARVYGEKRGDHWEGWLEFHPLDAGTPLRTDRETLQTSRLQLTYWATGLNGAQLKGAFKRARPVYEETIQPQPIPE